MPEDYIETKRGWVHKFRKACPHCNLPLDLEVFVPQIPPVPALKLKGGIRAKTTIKIDFPKEAPK